ncbi:mCG1048037 [Mus musculus]|nr:mCG1048037 [Mus musculus]
MSKQQARGHRGCTATERHFLLPQLGVGCVMPSHFSASLDFCPLLTVSACWGVNSDVYLQMVRH